MQKESFNAAAEVHSMPDHDDDEEFSPGEKANIQKDLESTHCCLEMQCELPGSLRFEEIACYD